MPDQIRFRSIDDGNRKDHYHLTAEDSCVYLMEYTPGQRFDFGEANSIISNLKKSPLLKAERQYHWKIQDMRRCTRMIEGALAADWLATGTLVPIPPSKTIDHPEYDDRMTVICRGIRREGQGVDVREMIRQQHSTDAAHLSPGNRPSLQTLISNYEVDEALCHPEPTSILLVDDVLTAGSHFKAAQRKLQQRFPDVPIYGAFIARCARPS